MKSWATKAEMDRFTRTANSSEAVGDTWARHGRPISAPEKPMDLATADALVRHLFTEWTELEAAAARVGAPNPPCADGCGPAR